MKGAILGASGLALIGAAAFAWHAGLLDRTAAAPEPAQAVAAKAPDRVIGVEELMHDVDRFTGTLRVAGVVAAARADTGAVALIDAAEFRKCGTTTCAELTLPVRWRGPMPALRDAVEVVGEVKSEGGKLVFVADQLRAVDAKGASVP